MWSFLSTILKVFSVWIKSCDRAIYSRWYKIFRMVLVLFRGSKFTTNIRFWGVNRTSFMPSLLQLLILWLFSLWITLLFLYTRQKGLNTTHMCAVSESSQLTLRKEFTEYLIYDHWQKYTIKNIIFLTTWNETASLIKTIICNVIYAMKPLEHGYEKTGLFFLLTIIKIQIKLCLPMKTAYMTLW